MIYHIAAIERKEEGRMKFFTSGWYELIAIGALLPVWSMMAADMSSRKVDPTFLRRYIPEVQVRESDVSTSTCRYKPIFGAGDSQPGILRGVERFGEITVTPGGACKTVNYATEEQSYVVSEGSGILTFGVTEAPLKKDDFLYLAAGVQHNVSNTGSRPLRLFVMGFKTRAGTAPPAKLPIANLADVKKQTVGGHPDSVVYQLMMGDTNSKRDKIAAGHLLVSLYVMTFEPGGTNFPHHHDNEEEIYVLLEGTGDMVAGSGTDGVEGRYPAKPGDAYFFRLNCTVGFYNSQQTPARILAVRSTYPRSRRPD
jgi:mannose-6-phosphate isomerase-like protein (cupin superfamily)